METDQSLDEDKCVIFKQDNLLAEGLPLMKEIRRQGKLCDVTLKVSHICCRKYFKILYNYCSKDFVLVYCVLCYLINFLFKI